MRFVLAEYARRQPKENAAADRDEEASSANIPSIHAASFCGSSRVQAATFYILHLYAD
jgi:hypothetical protein